VSENEEGGVGRRARIATTDINPAMLEFAERELRSDQVSFQRADAQDLPFDEGSFDLVLCQFGVMFFPDKVLAHQEERCVLRPNGCYLLITFNWLETKSSRPPVEGELFS